MVKKISVVLQVVLFFPSLAIGFLFACCKPGFETGMEFAEFYEIEARR